MRSREAGRTRGGATSRSRLLSAAATAVSVSFVMFGFRKPKRLEQRGGAAVALGNAGERVAERFLRKSGFRVLGRNVALAGGELDLVVQERATGLRVIVEVKAGRAHTRYRPAMRADHAKRRKLAKLTRTLAKLNGWAGQPVRIDVVEVVWPAGGEVDRRGVPRAKPEVTHQKGSVFRA